MKNLKIEQSIKVKYIKEMFEKYEVEYEILDNDETIEIE